MNSGKEYLQFSQDSSSLWMARETNDEVTCRNGTRKCFQLSRICIYSRYICRLVYSQIRMHIARNQFENSADNPRASTETTPRCSLLRHNINSIESDTKFKLRNVFLVVIRAIFLEPSFFPFVINDVNRHQSFTHAF